MKPYNKNKISFAKELRKNLTPWERVLWYDFLRNYPVKFQRQKVIDDYIVDFYCAKAHLIIELDGGMHYHPAQHNYDVIRTEILEKYDLFVLRIPNNQIDEDFYNVCEYIDNIVKKRIKHYYTSGDTPI